MLGAIISPEKVQNSGGAKPRLIVEMTSGELRQLKQAALDADVTVRELVMAVLKRAGLIIERGGPSKKP